VMQFEFLKLALTKAYSDASAQLLSQAATAKTASKLPSSAELANLLKLLLSQTISIPIAKSVFRKMVETGKSATQIIADEKISFVTDVGVIEQAAREVIAKNADNVAKFKSGNEGVFKFFVGQVMKATRGQADPQAVNDILRKLLSS
jgi:Asp-tRNA(Asn)/Glu-tRNA(Gln) amidotransferase B subunit